jgi:hypothetical protein
MMWEKHYRICLSAPLGERNGTMVLRESDGRVDGTLRVMNADNEFTGRLTGDGALTLRGVLRTLMSTMHYTASGTVCGRNILLNLKTDSGAYFPVSGEELFDP